MTIIEFFDKNAVENMLSALLCSPDKVIFIGNSKKQMETAKRNYELVLKGRGLEVELDCKGVDRTNLASIVQVLAEYVEETDLCVFNLDGGEDLYLVAVGIIAQRYGKRVQMHRFNVRNNTIIDCDGDGINQLERPIRITIDENVRIYGGKVIYEDERPGTTPRWVLNEEFCRDVRKMWQICRAHPGRWNWMIGQLNAMGADVELEKEELHLQLHHYAQWLQANGTGEQELNLALRALEEAGLIRNLHANQQSLSFYYKDAQVKQSMLKGGTLLELYITVVASALIENDERVYHDVRNGVWLDWDGENKKKEDAEVTNEVDVVLMCGAVPVFISCKNGALTSEACKAEMYKLASVANRFGGQYAKKVLALTQPEKMGIGLAAIKRRAEKLGIHLLMDVDTMPEAELEKELGKYWKT